MPEISGAHLLRVVTEEFRKLKSQADRALAQAGDNGFFARLDEESNSIAIIVKHVAGNLNSRFTDFLTTDGEKPGRNRDAEFEEGGAGRPEIMGAWEGGWQRLFETLEVLSPNDLMRTVTVRRESHTVVQALERSLTHTAGHIGQIVVLAKHLAGTRWQTLSVPKRRR
jgi:hypothetical protein